MESFESDLFENDELQDRELDAALAEWRAPHAPARLRRRVFREPWWRSAWRVSIRIPLPIAVALAIAVGLGAWRSTLHEVLKVERLDTTAVVAKNVDAASEPDPPVPLQPALQPGKELHPRVISAASDRNPGDQK